LRQRDGSRLQGRHSRRQGVESDTGGITDILRVTSQPGDQPLAEPLEVQPFRRQRARQDERLLGIVRHLSGGEGEPAATDELTHPCREFRRDLFAGTEFDRAAEGVPAGQSPQRPEVAIH